MSSEIASLEEGKIKPNRSCMESNFCIQEVLEMDGFVVYLKNTTILDVRTTITILLLWQTTYA
jgi:hypothetical protein